MITVSELIKELRAIVLVHPEAAQLPVVSRNDDGVLTSMVVVRLRKRDVIIEGDT